MRDFSYLSTNNDLMQKGQQMKFDLSCDSLQNYSDIQLRMIGAFFGNIIGDALGAPFEFEQWYKKPYIEDGKELMFPMTTEHMKNRYQTECVLINALYTSKSFNYRFGCTPGQWTDDSAQMMVLSEVLIQFNKLIGAQLFHGIIDWFNHAYCLPFNINLYQYNKDLLRKGEQTAYGLGETTLKSLSWFVNQQIPKKSMVENCFTKSGDKNSNSNGALMRNSPTFFFNNILVALDQSRYQALTTHQGTDQSICCMLHTFCGWSWINQQNLDKEGNPQISIFEEQIKKLKLKLSETMQQVINSEGEFNWRSKEFEPVDYQMGDMGSYAVTCICLALHYSFLYDAKSLQVLAARGGDADTNAAVLGALLGAKYGIQKFLPNWVQGVVRFDEFGYVCSRCAGRTYMTESDKSVCNYFIVLFLQKRIPIVTDQELQKT